MKFTTEQLWSIRFGLGIAQAWQDQKIEKGEGSCIPKSYYWDVIGLFDAEIKKRQDKSDIFRIRRIINLLNFFR